MLPLEVRPTVWDHEDPTWCGEVTHFPCGHKTKFYKEMHLMLRQNMPGLPGVEKNVEK